MASRDDSVLDFPKLTFKSSIARQTLLIVCEHGGRYNNVVRSLENRGAFK